MTDNIHRSSSKKRPNIHTVVASCFSKIADEPCWNPQQGHGSFLTLEFGEPHLIIDEYDVYSEGARKHTKKRNATVHGDWHLWIYCCHWQITLEDQPAVHSESSREDIAIALAQIRGQILTIVCVNPESGSSAFEFDLGGKIETRRYDELDDEGEPYENWLFFDDQDCVLTYRADGKYAYRPSEEPSHEWQV